ncbi:MAG: hypothetical protein ACKO7P_12810 [Bacteroidota bacterium]
MQFGSFIIGFVIGLLRFNDLFQGASVGIFLFLIYRLIFKSSNLFVFREWALILYSLNYLIAPAITYQLPEEQVTYGMLIPPDEYFNLALPGFLFFALGMYILPNKIFKIDYQKVAQSAVVNKDFLIKISTLGLVLNLSSRFFPGELGFIAYILSMVRFVGAFALLSIDKKLWYWSALVILFELASGFLKGMYHDAIMWFFFFGLFYIYALKPSFRIRMIGVVSSIALILFIQAVKFAYREQVWQGEKEATLTTVVEVGSSKTSSEAILGEENMLGTLNRGNQAWIFASTVNNMDRNKNFQGLTNVNKYLEAALLPRFLAPDKIKSGDKEIFNEFSGHFITEGTSMGLGIFADGYIAYGTWGVYIFGFVLGLIFSLTFKLVERWTKVSPFYVLLLLPLLNYAVRPDCELQTTINHLFKGILLYGFLVYLTRKRFTLDSQENQRKLLHLNLATNKK